MQLDMDLVRKILLWMESDPTVERMDYVEVDLGGVFEEELVTKEKLIFDGQGCNFLDEIRDEEIWQQTKEGAKKIGSFSIETIQDLAKAVIKKKIKDLTDGEFGV